MHLCLSGEEAGSKRSGKIDGGRTPDLIRGSLGRPSIFFEVREVADLRNSKKVSGGTALSLIYARGIVTGWRRRRNGGSGRAAPRARFRPWPDAPQL